MTLLANMTRGAVALSLIMLLTNSSRVSAQQPQVDAAVFSAGRPAGVPVEFLPTPFGWAHPSCIIVVAEDDYVTDDYVEHIDGTRMYTPRCPHPRFDNRGQAHYGIEPPVSGGWAARADNQTIGAVQWISATWAVPPAPTAVSGQTLYFFPGLEPLPSVDHILQPVLAWNGLFGNPTGWVGYSWKYANTQNYWVTLPAIAVNPGDTISGYAAGSGCNTVTGVCSTWQVRTSSSTQSNTLNTNASGFAENYLLAGVFEEYATTRCSNLPPSASITFSNVTVTAVGGGAVSPNWTGSIDPVANLAGCVNAVATSPSLVSMGWTPCDSGLTLCSGACANLNTDRYNCGQCGMRCGKSEVCSSGECTCSGGGCQ